MRTLLAAALLGALALGDEPVTEAPTRALAPTPAPWGFVGHEMAARAAAEVLPDEMPAFFRGATDRFSYLNPEPDRWRSRERVEMDQAFSYDHYIDLENVPITALAAPDRYTFIKALYDAGLTKPEQEAGFLPFRIVELYQRLVTEWEMWRAAPAGSEQRGWIEDRILNDAGILGHYVTDASQPHHSTIHFNGWNATTPNPNRYTEGRDFHARFERFYVEAHLTQADVSSRVTGVRSVAGGARPAVMDYIQETFAQVVPLYEIDTRVGFDPDGVLVPEARDFTADRLAAGADMLATLWWSAWIESAGG